MTRRAIGLFLLISGVLALSRSLPAAEPDAANQEFFEQRIRPVLAERCYACHSTQAKQQKKLQGGLLLDSREGVRSGGETGPAVVPNDVGRSLLIAAIKHQSG